MIYSNQKGARWFNSLDEKTKTQLFKLNKDTTKELSGWEFVIYGRVIEVIGPRGAVIFLDPEDRLKGSQFNRHKVSQ